MTSFTYVIAVTATLMIVSGVSVARSTEQADLERCAAELTAELRLACYEALTVSGRQLTNIPSTEVPGAEATPRQAVQVPDQPGEAAAAPISSAAISTAVESKASNKAGHDERISATVPATSTVAQTVEDARGESDAAAESAITASVVEVTTGRFDILYFHFANGQIWQQAQARRFRYPKDRAFEVTISTGMMGDFQLRVEGDGPMTRIRRIK